MTRRRYGYSLDDVLLDALCTYRLTRLVTMDELTREVRESVGHELEERGHPKLAFLITCPHCVGVYVGFGVVLVAPHLLGRAWPSVRAAVAASALTSLVASFEVAAHE